MESEREQGKESALSAVARRLTKSKGKLDQHDDVTRLNIRGLYIHRYILLVSCNKHKQQQVTKLSVDQRIRPCEYLKTHNGRCRLGSSNRGTNVKYTNIIARTIMLQRRTNMEGARFQSNEIRRSEQFST